MKNNFMSNYLITTFKTLYLALIPIFTFPYINRIILPELLGKVIWLNVFTDYLILLASFGNTLYAPRKISYIRKNKKELVATVNELFLLQILTFFIFFLVYIFIGYFFLKNLDKKLYMLFSLKFIFTCLSVEWYFQGMEKFSYISKRQILLNTFIIPFYYIFIKESSDYLKYAILLMSLLLMNSMFNFFCFTREIKLEYRFREIFKHLKPMAIIFITVALSSVYVSLDTFFLGIFSSSEEVAYYHVAIKLTRMIISVLLAGGVVISVKISEKGDIKKCKKILRKYFLFILLFFLPASLGLLTFSKELIFIIAGEQYLNSIIIMKLFSILLFLIGLSNIFGTQILYSFGKDKEVILSIFLSTLVNILLNIILIPKYGALGACIGTIIAETCACICFIYFSKKIFKISLLKKRDLKIFFSGVFMFIVINIYESKIQINNNFSKLFLGIFIGVFSYVLFLTIFKEQTLKLVIKYLKIKFKQKALKS